MRVIAGRLSGRNYEAPKGHRTHPMSEKMRGAIFGSLGDIEGLRVFDPFSGSGALAIEAVSRGASSAVVIEVDPRAYNVIKSNIVKLGIEDQVKVVKAYAGAWSTRHQIEKFDVVLLDPPYDVVPYRDLKRMARHVAESGVLVLSWPGKADWYPFEGLELVQSKQYGDSALHFYQRPHN